MLKVVLLLVLILPFLSEAKLAQLRKKFESKQWVFDKGHCNGFKKIKVKGKQDDICVGLITDKLNFPRYISVLEDSIYIVDKFSDLFDRDKTGKGRFLKINLKNKKNPKISIIADKLKSPSGLALWADSKNKKQYAFVSTYGGITRVNLKNPKEKPKIIIKNLPSEGWHFVSSLEVYKNNLFVNVGSQTDHCEKKLNKNSQCLEEGASAHIRKYTISSDGNIKPSFSIIAHGLRNSMAMAINPKTKDLWQGENSWDNVDLTDSKLKDSNAPFDEINIIKRSVKKNIPHYGWPYCYGKGYKTPGFNKDCNLYKNPIHELPAHSAPLDFLFYNSKTLKGSLGGFGLIATLHGFREHGQKIVYFDQLKSMKTLVNLNQQSFNKKGNKGRPLGLDNWGPHILVTDDWNHSLLIISRNKHKK